MTNKSNLEAAREVLEKMNKKKFKKEFKDMDSDALCKYCLLPEGSNIIRCYGNHPVSCEGSHCPEAYEAYLESDDYEEED
jgi:hypothetical protein